MSGALVMTASQVNGNVGGGGTDGGGGGTGGGGGSATEPLTIVSIAPASGTAYIGNATGGLLPYVYFWEIIAGTASIDGADDGAIVEIQFAGIGPDVSALRLTVTDDNGDTATATIDITVSGPA